jgi:membrane protein DedA with SNARE-associated domain
MYAAFLTFAVVRGWGYYAAGALAGSGAVRVSPRAFGAALLLMSLIWAGLQTVLGVALLEALASQAAPAVVALLAVLIIGRLALDRHRRRQSVVAAGV